MNRVEILDLLASHGALLEGHFELSSGRHSDRYVQKQRVYEQPRVAARLAALIVDRFRDGDTLRFDTVVSPAVGAIGFGTLTAFEAHRRFLFTEKVDGRMAFRRAQHLARGERVLIVEDVVTTGGSAAQVVDAVQETGAELVGVAAMVDRSTQPLPFALHALVRIDATSFDPAECPRCAAGEELVSPGSSHLRV